ncbi:MAG: hypothetical protein IPI85_10200 [Dehalococcoidia bacterium]|nr:hypothetical protein [Dehalococcoidia bacterium]
MIVPAGTLPATPGRLAVTLASTAPPAGTVTVSSTTNGKNSGPARTTLPCATATAAWVELVMVTLAFAGTVPTCVDPVVFAASVNFRSAETRLAGASSVLRSTSVRDSDAVMVMTSLTVSVGGYAVTVAEGAMARTRKSAMNATAAMTATWT